MNSFLRDRLLESIAADRLVIICGAGLSMGVPTHMPSAADVAHSCYERYSDIVGNDLNPELEWDLEALAEYFVANSSLPFFIETLVPWGAFAKPMNPGHAAIADLLLCKAARAAVSTNYDFLIERYALDQNVDFRASFTGDQADRATDYSPLLKPHGCAQVCREHTVWAPSQLDEGEIAQRLQNSQDWLKPMLREKDLLIIGFWSDWSYLNRLIADSLEGAGLRSITVVDPSESDKLQEKAERLWTISHTPGTNFQHVQMKGEIFLEELRRAFSQNWLRSMMRSGRQEFARQFPGVDPNQLCAVPETDIAPLYDRRRDAEGVKVDHAARRKRPPSGELLGFVHLLLRHSGAMQDGAIYRREDRSIRVLNGANRMIPVMRDEHPDPPSVAAADYVICVGAENAGVGNILRGGSPRHLFRPASSSQWLTVAAAREVLEL